ncbi:MAG: PKD domain-containing protein, partial [Thermoplasmata archaeon]|nr:PKD domain-containing protein [Thermoplasmata archaeon]
ARTPSFSNANETAWIDGGLTPLAKAAGDVNGDDVEELVVISDNSPLVECYLGFGGTPVIITLGYVPREVIVEDFNKDGSAEVLVFSTSSKTLSVVSGASLYPGSVRQLTCGGKVMDVTTGDLDNRYGTDIVAATDEGELNIFFNGGGSIPFGTPHEFSPTPGVGIWSIAVGDFDSDGLEDIAYTRPIRKITVLYQSPTSAFSTSSMSTNLTHTDGPDFTAIWSGDITGDGKDDIVGMRPSDPSLYLFDQLDFVSSPYPYATLDLPEVPFCVSVTDATDDGPSDVLAIFGSADLVFLYRQSGSGLPDLPSMVFVAGARPVFVTIGDGTGDHRGDLLSLDAGSKTVSMWQQVNFGPVADAGGPYHAEEGSSVQFEGSAITGTSEIPYMEYNWSFGDGSETGWVRNPRPTHTYLAVGNFTIDVDVRDPVGLTSSDSTYVVVEDASPHVAFTWSPEPVAEGVNVTFEDTSTSYDPIASREWTVDGVPAGGSEALKVEFQDGNHTVTLELADSDGSVRSLTELIPVASSAPDLRLTGPAVVTEGIPAQFQVFVDEWHGAPVDPVVLYEWDFFYVPGNFVPDLYAPSSDTVSRIFSADSYIKVNRVAVRVTDSDGESNITTWDIWVYDTPPSASFVITDPSPVEGTPFSFLSYSTSYDGIVNWTWELEYPGGGIVWYYDTGQQMALRQFDELDNGVYTMTLSIRELDGNTSSTDLTFTVLEIPPSVVLSTVPVDEWPGYYQEFYTVTFEASVLSLDSIVSYQWDFSASGGEFVSDATTAVNHTVHLYGQIGNYTAKVRVTDSDGSYMVQSVFVEIRDKPIFGDFGGLVRVIRDPNNTSNVTLDFLPLLYWFPDANWVHIEFGDGSSVTVEDDLLIPVHHSYVPGDDYMLNGTFRDDDGYTYSAQQVFWCDPPTISMINPFPGAVIRSGTLIVFQIEPGSTQLKSAVFAVDGSSDWGWSTLYTIDTANWVSWNHSIVVTAKDYGGNTVRLATHVIVDNVTPEALLHSSRDSVYAGDKLNITIRVDDDNVEASGIVLFVQFQGDESFSSFSVGESSENVFFRVFNVPLREGNVSFYAIVTDLAGNSMETPLYTVAAEYRFIYWAWPYLVLTAAVAAFATGGYFFRESRLAVDEAFVVYNDGRLISHSTRRLKPGMDDHVLGSMFVAIQDFVRDSFKDVTSFTLRRLDFGDKSIVIEKGEHVFLAAVLHGQASRKVAVRMQQVVEEVEEVFGAQLEGWDGNLEKTRGVGDILKKMYSKTPVFAWSLRRKP